MSIAPSPAEQRVLRIKQQAVLGPYLREGPIWEAVRAVRDKWEITPVVDLPPADLPTPHPNGDPFDRRYDQWYSDVAVLALKLGRGRFYRAADWERFAAALVLYDPPETNEGDDLLAFAEYGGANRQRVDRTVDRTEPDGTGLSVVAPVVRRVPSRAQSQQKIVRYYDAILNEFVRRYVEPIGKSGSEALEEIIREGRLEEILGEPVDTELAIFPDEHSTQEEILEALEAIRSNPGGRSPMSGLVAVVAAIKHDDHNHRNPQKRSERRYAYPKLAEVLKDYGVRTDTKKPGSSAEGHVELGRELRAVRAKNLEKQ